LGISGAVHWHFLQISFVHFLHFIPKIKYLYSVARIEQYFNIIIFDIAAIRDTMTIEYNNYSYVPNYAVVE